MKFKKVQYLGDSTNRLTRLNVYLLDSYYDDEIYGWPPLPKTKMFEIKDDLGDEYHIVLPNDDWEPCLK